MVTEKFRRLLRQESEKWWTEGLIDAELHEKLAERYQFHQLERDASNRFVGILMGLGGILLGLGVITFIAANWLDWSRSFKVMLLLSLFIGINAAGFYLWRRSPQHGLQKLGHGLLILGALTLGANLSLMSQMFHQSGNFYQLLLVWGLGVFAMASSLPLTSLGVLSLILIGWGYGLGWIDQSIAQDNSLWQLLLRHMPLIGSLLALPLAHWCRSRVIFALGAILVATSLVFNLRPLSGWAAGQLTASGWIAMIAFTLPPALLWSYHRNLWKFSSPSRLSVDSPRFPRSSDPFQPIARSLAVWFLSILFYIFAFHWVWEVHSTPGLSSDQSISPWQWQSLIDAIVLAIFAGLGWLQLTPQLRYQLHHRSLWVQEKAVNTGTVAAMLALTAGTLLWHFAIGAILEVATLNFNLLLFGLAIALIRDGLALGSRRTFWGGMLLLVLGIVSRMLEYNTGLLLKSIVFVICGIGVIFAGLWFERNARPRTKLALPKPSQEGML
jgi:uncharacterized membrane protein